MRDAFLGQARLAALRARVAARLDPDLRVLLVRLQDEARDALEPLEDALAFRRHGSERWRTVRVEAAVELFEREQLAEIPLVPMERVRHLLERAIVLAQVRMEVIERFLVDVDAPGLGIGNEDDAVGAGEHQFPGRCIIHLPGNGEELQANRHAAHAGHSNRQKVEIKRAIRRRREGHHLAAVLRFRRGMDVLQRGGLPSKPRTVEHQLEDELPRMRVD
jgi:hypothetical protein